MKYFLRVSMILTRSTFLQGLTIYAMISQQLIVSLLFQLRWLWLEKCSSHGHGELLRKLIQDDYRCFFLRMGEQLFQNVVSLVSPLIKK